MTKRVALLLVGLLLAPAAARAQQAKRPEFVGLQVGFAGRYSVGQWTPVQIALQGGSHQLTGLVTLTVPDGDGVPSRTHTNKPVQVLPGRKTPVSLFARFGTIDSNLTAEFHVEGRVVAKREFRPGFATERVSFLPALPSAQRLIVVVGSASVGMEEAVESHQRDPDLRSVVVRLDDVSQLPTQWYGYEGVSVLVLSTSRSELYRKLTPISSRIDAMDEWVRMGGRLVLCVGSQAEEVLDEASPLARFAPGRLKRTISLRQTGALETYSAGSSPIPRPSDGSRLELRVAQLADVRGTVEANEADLPLVVRTARSFGQVIFVAVDLDRPPLSRWKDRGLLAARLLDFPATIAKDTGESTQVTHYGHTDMSGQLRRGLNQFTGVRLVPFSLVALLIVVYILLIGPGDYFFLRKIVRRMEWTWLTFPLTVIVFSLGASALAYRLKGDQLRVNQVDLIDVDVASRRVRGTTWANIFSPRMDSYNLSFRCGLPGGRTVAETEMLTSWFGSPGDGFGGMAPSASNPTLWRQEYDFSPALDTLSGIPIQVWSTKSITARFSTQAGAFPEADLVRKDELLSGTITNTLDFPLQQCVLASGRHAYELGTLKPDDSAYIAPEGRRVALRTLLTGRKFVFEEGRQQTTPYDSASLDVRYILRAMIFNEAAGGRQYTGLLNSYQQFVDLSSLLKTRRAILVAWGPDQAADGQRPSNPSNQLLRDGKPMGSTQGKHLVVYRFVFPLKTEGSQ